MREKQKLQALSLKIHVHGQDDMQQEQMHQLNLGLYKKQLLLATLHHQTSTLQQDKD